MNKTADNNPAAALARYSVWSALFGVLSYLFFFPNGIYYCFFLGVMALTAGILARKSGVHTSRSTAGILVGIFDILLSLAAFYGMYIIYSSLSDPVMGPKVTRMILQILEQNGLTLSSFTRVMY
jgi:hypothetical protein